MSGDKKGPKPWILIPFSENSLFQAFRILRDLQRVNHLVNVAVHERLQVEHGQANTVIGDAALGIIIGSDFGGTVSGGYQIGRAHV